MAKAPSRSHTPLAICMVTLFLLPSAAGLLPGGVEGVNAAPWRAWRTEMAYDEAVSLDTRLALDAEENPAITFSGEGPTGWGSVFLTYRQHSVWWSELVDDKGRAGGIALDSEGRVHLSYMDADMDVGEYDTIHAVRTGGQWVKELIIGEASLESQLHLDSGENPHVAYHNGTGDLRYAYRVGDGVWQVETVATKDGYHFGFALDSQDRPHLAYMAGAAGSIRYAVRAPNGGWSIADVPGCTSDVSLALDSQDRPHVACREYSKGLVYLHQDAQGVWHEEVADNGCREALALCRPTKKVAFETSIAIDSHDQPHISYDYHRDWGFPELFPGHLHYATKQGGEWHVETVDRVGADNGAYTSLALDSHDRPHISYILNSVTATVPSKYFDLMYAEPASAPLGLVGE